MRFQYLTNVSLEEARESFLSRLKEEKFGRVSSIQEIPVAEACGKRTAEAVYAGISAPHYPASAMDGIAVVASDTFGATETTPVLLSPEQYIVVDTGDLLPEGRDAVVMIEDVIWEGEKARLHSAASPWQHVRQIGEDICAGEMILPAHTEITPASIGAMIAGGVLKVKVMRPPVVAVIPTGDEIVPPSENPAPGEILEFNSSIFSSMLTQWKAVPKVYPIVKDVKEEIRRTLEDALNTCDMVILNAGSSAGREDYAAEAIGEAAELLYHGIAIKPGKPAILAQREGKPVIGVPGYPVSGIIVLEELARPLIDAWYACRPLPAETIRATLTRTVVSGFKYQEYVRVRLGQVGGRMVATPLSRGAGVVSSFMKADGIFTVPQGVEGYEAGSEIDVRLLRDRQALSSTVVAIGSHDPLLDEVANLLHLSDPSLYMSSSHVGSMGGIMAVRRKEAHLAGIHLLDERDGSYNTSFVKKYFPAGGVRLVECVYRTQGLMTAKGNPLGIKGIQNLEKLRYVNRQKGSGTRILIDYLCKKEGVDPAAVYGYDREEFTHTSVAAQIASGSADAGMGIYSAAKLYDLDFLPVCLEQYDLLIPEEAFETEMVQKVLEVLKSREFADRLEELGGYELRNPGTVRM